MASTRSVSSDARTVQVALLLHQFSVEITDVIERVIGTSSNHEVQVLAHLYGHPRQRPRDMMAVTGLTRPSVATLVGRLERLGLVERTFGETDRRTTLASLTARGRRRMLALDREVDDYFGRSHSLISQMLELCGGDPAGGPAVRPAGVTGLVLAGELGAVGARLVTAVSGDGPGRHPRQLHAAVLLHSWGPSRPGRLAEALALSSGGLTYLMDQMVADGLVHRTHGHPDDRRAVVIELTDAGHRIAVASASSVAAERDELRRVLAQVLAPVASAPV